jgi:hypothetical protein
VFPHSKGGSDDLSNLVAACKKCNSEKGTKLPENFTAKKYKGPYSKKDRPVKGPYATISEILSWALAPVSERRWPPFDRQE